MDALQTVLSPQLEQRLPAPVNHRLPDVAWRDLQSVEPEKLAELIASLEEACMQNPGSVALHTCLGMAYAMNYDVYRSMDALEEARRIDPADFLAQLKYSELLFRLRVIEQAEEETRRALELACKPWELSVARRQLSEIRRLKREGLVRGGWMHSLKVPAVGFMILLFLVSCAYLVVK
jgi:tetratricopeptide (TPR) repeat protein